MAVTDMRDFMSQRAQNAVVGARDVSPDDAAQAVNLEDQTGVPATVTVDDVGDYTTQHQNAMAQNVVRGDPWVQSYLTRHPMAAAVSKDDFHNLVDMKNAFNKIWRPEPDYSLSKQGPQEFFKAFKEGYGRPEDEIPDEINRAYGYINSPLWRKFVKYGLGEETIAAAVKAEHVFRGLTEGASGYLFGSLQDWGMSPEQAISVTRELRPVTEQAIMLGEPEGELAAGALIHKETLGAVRAIGPYAEAGREPPPGIHKEIANAAKDKAKTDAKNLKELEGAYDKSETARRSQVMGGHAIDSLGSQEIGISAEGVRRIYGDEIPSAGDNKLGSVIPNLAEKLRAVEEHNGDIKIPLKDWLQKVDPELRKELNDDVRVRDLSVNDAKDMVTAKPDIQHEDATYQALKEAGGFQTFGDKILKPERMEAAEIKERAAEIAAEEKPTTEAKQLELPGVTRVEDEQLFDDGKFGGIGKGRMKRYVKAADEEREELIAAQKDRITREEKRRQTGEWKINWAAMREQAEKDIRDRPDVQALLSLDAGEFKIAQATTKESVHPDYSSQEGMSADHVASWFGYGTGDEMMRAVNNLRKVRKDAGLLQKTFLDKLTDTLTDKRMAEKYGKLAENIIREANDRLYSAKNLDRLHEDTIHLAEKAGQELPIAWKDLKAKLKAEAEDIPIGSLNPKQLSVYAGKITQAIEDVLKEGNVTQGLKLAQQREIVMARGAIAKDAARLKESFDRFAKTYSQVSDSLPLEYNSAVHGVLQRVGIRTQPGIPVLSDMMGFFADKIEKEYKNWKIPGYLNDKHGVTPLNELSLGQFRELNTLLRQMVQDGKNEKMYFDGLEKKRLDDVKSELKNQLETFEQKTDAPERGLGQQVSHVFHTYLLQFPTLLKRMDNFRVGPWTKYVMRPLTEGGSRLSLVAREFQADAEALPTLKRGWLGKKVDNSLLRDPFTGRLITLRNSNVVELARYMGSPSSWEKAWRGWGLTTGDELKKFVEQHMTPEAWDWVQRAGKMNAKADRMLREDLAKRGEVPYESIDLPPVTINIDGKPTTVDGWYNHVHYNKQYGQRVAKTPEEYFQKPWISPTAPPGFYKSRTNYFAPVDLSIGHFATDMNQRIRDMAVRPAVKEVSKVLNDPATRSMIADRMGKSAAGMIDKYLEDYATGFSPASVGENTLNRWTETLRRRMIGNLAGLNLDILSKHAPTAGFGGMFKVGPVNFLRSAMMLMADAATGHKNWQFMLDSSKEMRVRGKHTVNSITGETEVTLQQGLSKIEAAVQAIGQAPFNIIDMTVSAATWHAAYRDALRTVGHDEAVARADEAVRETHATSNIAYLPGIARQRHPAARMLVAFYNFMNTMMQQEYKAVTMANDAYRFVKKGEVDRAWESTKGASMALFLGAVLPSLFGQVVEKPPTEKETNSWFWHRLFGWGPSVGGTVGEAMGMVPVAGGMIKSAMGYHNSLGGLIDAAVRIPKETISHLNRRDPLGRDHASDLVRDFVELAGEFKGYGNDTLGNLAKWMYDYYQGTQPLPENAKTGARILTRGDVHKEGPWEALPGRAPYVKKR